MVKLKKIIIEKLNKNPKLKYKIEKKKFKLDVRV
jgi:hypothetical protein